MVVEIAITERANDGSYKVTATNGDQLHVDRFNPDSAFSRQKFRDAVIAKFALEPSKAINEHIENQILGFVQSVPPLGGRIAGIEFSPVPITELTEADAVNWLWNGWLARGSVTLLVGLWKSGKTTLISHLLRTTKDGGNIAGEIVPQKVLVVSEETAGIWNRRREELGIGANVHLQCRPFKGKPRFGEWFEFIQRVKEYVIEHEIDLVVLDPWQSLNPSESENDSSPQIAALMPLHEITNAREAGCAVLLLHHPRKGESSAGQSARGSGALPAFVDVIAELSRFSQKDAEDTRRKLTGMSRYEETPKECVIDLTPNGYETLGNVSTANATNRIDIIGDILRANDAKLLTVDQVHKEWPESSKRPGLRTLRDDLTSGHENGTWARFGTGKRGDPHIYGVVGFEKR